MISFSIHKALLPLVVLACMHPACSNMMSSYSEGDVGDGGDAGQAIVAAPCRARPIGLDAPGGIAHGYATFGDPAASPVRCDETPVQIPSDYDTGANGPFAAGTYVRIIENGRNIVDPSGLNLSPVSADTDTPRSPSARLRDDGTRSGECGINAARGWFVLPRPAWWHRLESWDSLSTPVINEYPENAPTTALISEGQSPAAGFYWLISQRGVLPGTFGNAIGAKIVAQSGLASLRRYSTYQWSASREDAIDVFGGAARDLGRGTLSCWIRLRTVESTSSNPYASIANRADASVTIQLSSAPPVRVTFSQTGASACTVSIVIGDATMSSALPHRVDWQHVYIVWDASRSLNASRAFMLFVNGALHASHANEFPDLSGGTLRIMLAANAMSTVQTFGSDANATLGANDDAGSAGIDNLQIWNHVAAETPVWIYNAGAGRENALHAIYSPENGYRPLLTGAGNGVEYFVPGEP